MASSSTTPVLAERSDIHKSCKSIETLLNILSEYCEAAGAVVSLQKKLAKALKDAAGSKATAEIASNAMLASASVFESLSDVDSKFSKTLDKEYDTISDEVKKSFKKLTKEEKVHDEKMLVANAKIKQAGQTYEKKAKKKAVDVNEEHARYISLISTLGPEISQDKYNHAVTISKRHTIMIYGVASCLARLADLEWQKSCECVRRFSPTIGPLGSLRSLCEGGWTGPIPPDLPDITPGDAPKAQSDANTRLGAIEEVAEHQQQALAEPPNPTSMNGFDTLNEAQIPPNLIQFPSFTTTSGNTLQPPNVPFVDPINTGSVRSLSAFPTPPSHFPLPPLQQQQQTLAMSFPARSSTSPLEFPSSSPLADSPISVHDDLSSRETGHAQQPNSAQSSERNDNEQTTRVHEAKSDRAPAKHTAHRPLPHRSQSSLVADHSLHNSPPQHAVEIKPLNLKPHRDRDSPTAREFSLLGSKGPSPTKSRTMDNFKYPKSIERTDTGTSTAGSIVAAMRNRYDNTSGSTSPLPPLRDLPRLPLHVNNMAARYQNNELQQSPDSRTTSPPVSRQQSHTLLDATRQGRESYTTRPNSSDEERRLRQREDELAESLRKQKEQELRDREVELEARARELERDRTRLQALRAIGGQRDTGYTGGIGTHSGPGQLGLHRKERRVSLRHQLERPLSKLEIDEVNEHSLTGASRAWSPTSRTEEPYPQHLSSANILHTPQATLPLIHSPKPSHPPSPILQSEGHSQTSNRSPDDVSHSYTSTSTSSVHAPFCGCEKCSISKYRDQPRRDPPNESRRSEKSKLGTGWIRRLSMPGINNAKKHQSNNSIGIVNSQSLGAGIASGGSNKSPGLFSLDSKKNISTTGLGVDEDGRFGRSGGVGGVALGRRSYDFAGMNNRSMTNLKLR